MKVIDLEMKKFKKIRKFRNVRESKIEENLDEIVKGASEGLNLSSYEPHKVNLDGRVYKSYDAKAINRQMHQSGRGDYRYYFSKKDEISIYMHKPNGKPILECKLGKVYEK